MKKIVILTGSTGNLGSMISERMKDEKDIIPILVSSRKKVKGTFYVNFKSSSSIQIFFKTIKKKYGAANILINNAAVSTLRNFSDFVNQSDDKRIHETYLINSISQT